MPLSLIYSGYYIIMIMYLLDYAVQAGKSMELNDNISTMSSDLWILPKASSDVILALQKYHLCAPYWHLQLPPSQRGGSINQVGRAPVTSLMLFLSHVAPNMITAV